MSSHPFRFGVTLLTGGSATHLRVGMHVLDTGLYRPAYGPGTSPRPTAPQHTITELRRLVDSMPLLMVAGSGKRMLRLAAREANII